MRETICVLGVDVGGKAFGVAAVKGLKKYLYRQYTTTTRTEFYNTILEWIKKYKPDVIIIGKPNRFYDVILKQAEYIGLVNMAAEQFDVQTEITNDSTARAVVFPGFGAAKKEKIHELAFRLFPDFPGDAPDALDALIFAYHKYKLIIENEKRIKNID